MKGGNRLTDLSRHIQIRVGKQQGKELDRLASKNGLKTSSYIRELLYQKLAKLNLSH